MQKIDLNKIFKIKIKKNIKLRHMPCINPIRGWSIFLKVALISSLFSIIFSLYMFFQIKNEQFFNITPENTVNTEIINQKLLEETLQSFKDREEKASRILNGEYSFIDPS